MNMVVVPLRKRRWNGGELLRLLAKDAMLAGSEPVAIRFERGPSFPAASQQSLCLCFEMGYHIVGCVIWDEESEICVVQHSSNPDQASSACEKGQISSKFHSVVNIRFFSVAERQQDLAAVHKQPFGIKLVRRKLKDRHTSRHNGDILPSKKALSDNIRRKSAACKIHDRSGMLLACQDLRVLAGLALSMVRIVQICNGIS